MIPINIRTNSLKGVRWYEGFKRIKQFIQILCVLVAVGCFFLIGFSRKFEEAGLQNVKLLLYFLIFSAIVLEVFIEISFRVLVWIIKGFLPKEEVV
jgi:hypothetical protein